MGRFQNVLCSIGKTAGIVLFLAGMILLAVIAEFSSLIVVLTVTGLIFVIVSLVFSPRESPRKFAHTITVFTILGILGMLNVFAVWMDQRYDLTEGRIFSLSSESIEIINRIYKPVDILFFYSERDPRLRHGKEMLREYERQSAYISVEFVDLMTNPSRGRAYNVRFPGTTILLSGDNRVEVFGGEETDFTNGILKVTREERRNIYFIDGHGEYDIDSRESHDHFEGDHGHSHTMGGGRYIVHERHGMGRARNALETMNYNVDKLFLFREMKIPDDAELIIIAGPLQKYLPQEVELLKEYAAGGGNLFIMLNPWIEHGLDLLLEFFGVVAIDDMIVDPGNHFWNDKHAPAIGRYTDHRITRNLPLTFFPGVRSLQKINPLPEDVRSIELFETTRRSRGETWVESDAPDVHYEKSRVTDGPHTLMMISRREIDEDSEAVLAVIGDTDFASNSYFSYLGNGNLFLNTVMWLMEEEQLIDIKPKEYDPPVVNLTNRQMQATFLSSTILLPFIIICIGIIMWLKRR